MFSHLSCPIENHLIIEKKRSIDENYPFMKSSGKRDSEIKIKKWRKVKLSTTSDSYWFFGEGSTPNEFSGFGMLYLVGKYSEYLIEGEFKDSKIVPKLNYLKIFRNGESYVGPLNSNFDLEGEGELLYCNGGKYIGEFKHGMPHGRGEFTSKK